MGAPIGRTLENDVTLSSGMNRIPENFSERERGPIVRVTSLSVQFGKGATEKGW